MKKHDVNPASKKIKKRLDSHTVAGIIINASSKITANRRYPLLKIGDFSKLSRVSVRMLRHYDEIGLLKLAETDRFTDYRYYREDQLPTVCRITALYDFPNHPFKVRDDEAMQETAESIRQYGVLVPAIVRPREDGGYEIVAGHRRSTAAN